MAEARSIASLGHEFKTGVALSVDNEGLHIRTEFTVPPPREAWRRAQVRMRRGWRQLQYVAWPLATPSGILAITVLVIAAVLQAPEDSWLRSGSVAHVVWYLGEFFPWIPGIPLWARIAVLAAWCSLGSIVLLAWVERLLLKALLSDKAWLYQARSPGIWVRVWFVMVRALTRGRAYTYSFQGSMPRMAVPAIEDTVSKYLASARLLQDDTEFKRTAQLAAAFLANEGPKLQRYLVAKSWFASNYVTDWWEKYVYLRGRSPIAVNSNYYCLDSGRSCPTPVQEARAAILVWTFMKYKEQLEAETIPPVMAADGVVPLDMWQYERMFSTSRIPGRECDEVRHWDSTQIRHIAVTCKGSIYRLNVYRTNGTLLGPDEIEDALCEIKADASARKTSNHLREAEVCLPALTADNRTKWAEARELHFSEGINRRSLDTIERALIWLALDDSATDVLDWTGRGRAIMCGNRSAPNVWFDKSLSLLVFANGKAGVNAEHSWADAPVMAHLMEMTLIVGEHNMNPYDPLTGHVKSMPDVYDTEGLRGCSRRARSYSRESDGASSTSGSSNIKYRDSSTNASISASTGTAAVGPSTSAYHGGGYSTSSGANGEVWYRLHWSLSAECEDAIKGATGTLHGLMDDLDLSVSSYSSYGKDFVKKCRVSPDAYVQMAMQLAYYRDQGRFDATYESSMTRLFLHGRTETVRPVTDASCAFVRTMADEKATPKDKLKALQSAAARHVQGYTDAMAGAGIDRHLFALYCVAVGTNRESSFLKSALSVPWKLSTSQQPQQQTNLWDIKDVKWATKISPGGGFGPVTDDGYGVSYMVSGEREFFFHISSLRKSHPKTDAARFRSHLFSALDEMREILSHALHQEKVEKEEARSGEEQLKGMQGSASGGKGPGSSAAAGAAHDGSAAPTAPTAESAAAVTAATSSPATVAKVEGSTGGAPSLPTPTPATASTAQVAM